MRIISQDGMTDLPYDMVLVSLSPDGKTIISYDVSTQSRLSFWTLAKYSTREKAIQAMEMCRTEYERHFYGNGGLMATADLYVPPFAFIPPKIFRFPQDSEV